jgi:branched-chain amino acid transport system permease protein
MSQYKTPLLFAGVALLFLLAGVTNSWNYAFSLLNFSLIFAVMALGLNMQWGFAGLFNTGLMGFAALGGLAVVLVASEPVPEGWALGGWRLMASLAFGVLAIGAAVALYRRMHPGRNRNVAMVVLLVVAFVIYRAIYDPAVIGIESYESATYGNMGGLGLPALIAWPVGGLLAAAAAWAIGKTALGLRSDYLAIATLGIAEIIVSVLKNEDWLARGVKMVNDLPRPWPVAEEVVLQQTPWFTEMAASWGFDPVTGSSILVKLTYALIFLAILAAVIWLNERALSSPWGRMMRAIRDNEVSAAAMGKDVKRQHLQVFILGSAIVGMGGAMLTNMQGLMNPGTYNPLQFTFLIWVMVIVGGSGSNWGSVLGGLFIGWLWLVAENLGPGLMQAITALMPEGFVKTTLNANAQHMRLLFIGVILLLVLRFNPRGLIPEK